jgi:hypothetical protein
MVKRSLLFALLFFAACGVFAQSTARVVFYRPKYAAVSTHLDSASVWIDGVKAVIIDPRRRAVAELPEGKHEFRSNSKSDLIVINLEAGKTYYLRQGYGYPSAWIRNIVTQVDADTGEAQSRDMKLVDRASVLDHHLITEPR